MLGGSTPEESPVRDSARAPSELVRYTAAMIARAAWRAGSTR
jgi:hypothetical protein